LIGDKYITEPVPFETGEYKITDFLVANKNGEIIYATPKEGSPYEGAVDDALPITFVVTTNEIQDISPQVIATIDSDPDNFGYKTFSLNIVETMNFLIGVFTYDDDNNTVFLTGSKLTITSEDKDLYSGVLSSKTNTVAVPKGYDNYTVIVSKSGYNDYVKTFSIDELKDYTEPEGLPLVVVLRKPKGLIFWNKLGSIDEILNSEVGPGIQLTSYKVKDWEQAKIVEGKFGNGLFVNHDIKEGWKNDGGNFFAIDNQSTGLDLEKGCIEFWFIFKYDCSTHNHAYFLSSADILTDHFNLSTKTSNIGMYAVWNGWDYGSYGKRYMFGFSNSYGYNERLVTENYSVAPGGDHEFKTDQLVHFGYVWDKEGIDGTSETLRLYIDGVLIIAQAAKLTKTDNMQKFMYIGSRPNRDRWDHHYNAVKGVIDNLKIWNYAKTDFSDRFKE
jgi:hypothetical protein